MQINYTQVGDYRLPNLTVRQQSEQTLGKYGLMRKNYLLNHRRPLFNVMLLNGTLQSHFLEIDQQAMDTMESMETSLLQQNPLPQTDNTLELTQHRERIRHQAEEAVLAQLIYS